MLCQGYHTIRLECLGLDDEDYVVAFVSKKRQQLYPLRLCILIQLKSEQHSTTRKKPMI